MLKNKSRAVVKADVADSNRDVILSYIEADGEGMELTDKQEQLLERWSTADELIRSYQGQKTREGVAKMLVQRYVYSLRQAHHDIVNAEHVFSSSKPLNKKYLIGVRIEFIQNQIFKAQHVNDFIAVASLEKVLQGYIDMYPDVLNDRSPKTIIYNVDPSLFKQQLQKTEDAIFTIDEALKELPDAAE